MRVHSINCATMCPRSARLVNGTGGLRDDARMVCHCLLVESDDGLVLVDTGLGTRDVAEARTRLGREILAVMRPRLDPDETAIAHVRRLGFRPEDVRHVVPTHLDFDHAGGLGDFPRATVHVHRPELDAALLPRTFNERQRYRPAPWAHGPQWAPHDVAGDRWLGFDAVRPIAGTEILLVPLVGHTRGHAGVAVKTGEGWILHAGDAYFHRGDVHDGPACPPLLAAFQRLIAFDDRARRANQARLRELARDRAGEVRVISAHCPFEYDAMARGPEARPAWNGASARENRAGLTPGE